MPYQADETGQIRRLGDKAGFDALETHELRDGKTLCGVKARPWKGYTMRLVRLGPGTVTCDACAKAPGH